MSTARRKLDDFKQSSKPKMIPVHLEPEEVRYFNYMQGGQFIDPETHLRDYSRLWEVIKQPKMKEFLGKTMNYVRAHGKSPHNLEKAADELDQVLPPFEEIPSDREEKSAIIADLGQGKDKVLVMMPIFMVNFLDELRGASHPDKALGLEQFGWKNFFKSVVRVAAPIVGFVAGGPLGAGIGGALGNAATGANLQKSLTRGAFAGAAGYGASMIPGLNSLAGGIASGLGLTGSSAAAASTGAAATSAASSAASSATGSGILDTIKANALPLAAGAAGMALLHKGQQQKYQHDKREKEEQERKMAHNLEAAGYNEGLTGPGLRRPHRLRHEDYAGPVRRLKTGGIVNVKGEPIIGPGKGQDDVINRDDIKEGGWIWDASTTADLGDGATDAGQKHIEKFENVIKKHMLKPLAQKIESDDREYRPRYVPCALSNGERHTPRELVTALGGGKNEVGAKVLRKMTKEIRLHKASNGDKLPPPAFDLMQYYKKVI